MLENRFFDRIFSPKKIFFHRKTKRRESSETRFGKVSCRSEPYSSSYEQIFTAAHRNQFLRRPHIASEGRGGRGCRGRRGIGKELGLRVNSRRWIEVKIFFVTARTWLGSPRNFAKRRFGRFPTFHFLTPKKIFSRNFRRKKLVFHKFCGGSGDARPNGPHHQLGHQILL